VDIQITGRHASVTDAMKSYATDKFSKLERHNDMLTRAEVVLNAEKGRHGVEMIAHTKVGGPLVGKAEHSDMYAAIDLCLDKMEHQITKQKEKVKLERKHDRTKASGAKTAGGRQTGSSGKGKVRPPAAKSAEEE
jgi:putative sigma-54 modulation protein